MQMHWLQMHSSPASSLNPNLFKGFHTSKQDGDVPGIWWRMNRSEWEGRCACVYALYMFRGKLKKERSKLPLCQSKKPIVILNQRWKDTMSCSHAIQHSGLNQNNYCIMSSSDNPRLIRLGFACRIGAKKSPALSFCMMFPSCRLMAGCTSDWKVGSKVQERSSSTRQKWHSEKNVFVRKIELHHPVTQLLELLHCCVLLVEDGGLGNGEITFVSLQLAHGLMKLILT